MKNPSHKTEVSEANRIANEYGVTLHPSLLKKYPVGTPFYCLHHAEGTPVEFLEEPLINRVLFVLREKPPEELTVRFAAMRPVLGKLPKAYVKARAAYVKARDACLPFLLALWEKDYPDHPKWTAKDGLKF